MNKRPILHTLICLVAVAVLIAGGNLLRRRLDRRRFDPDRPLARPGLEALTPQEFVGTVLAGGLRGVGVNVLWIRAASLMEEGRYDELAAVTEAISRMEPNQPTAWTFHAWNLAFNVAGRYTNPEDRFRWMRRGLDHAITGAEKNPRDPRLAYWVGWIAQRRLCSDPYYVGRLADDRVHLGGGAVLVGRVVDDETDRSTREVTIEAGVGPVRLGRHHVRSVVEAIDEPNAITVTLVDGTRLEAERYDAEGDTPPSADVLALERVTVPRTAIDRFEPGRDAWGLAFDWFERAARILDETGAPIDTAPWIYHGQSRLVFYRQAEALLARGELDGAAKALDAYALKLDQLMTRYDEATSPRIHRVFQMNRYRELPRLAIRLSAARARAALASNDLDAAHQYIDATRRQLEQHWPLLTEDALRRPGMPLYRELLILKNDTLPEWEERVQENREQAPGY